MLFKMRWKNNCQHYLSNKTQCTLRRFPDAAVAMKTTSHVKTSHEKAK
jgi:hypothetical protein